MNNITLTNTVIKKINFTNDFIIGEPLELDIAMNYNVEVDQKENNCVAKLSVAIKPKKQETASSLVLEAEIHGYFTADNFSDQNQTTVKTYERLFPYLQVYVSNITAIAGIPPLVLPETPMDMICTPK